MSCKGLKLLGKRQASSALKLLPYDEIENVYYYYYYYYYYSEGARFTCAQKETYANLIVSDTV